MCWVATGRWTIGQYGYGRNPWMAPRYFLTESVQSKHDDLSSPDFYSPICCQNEGHASMLESGRPGAHAQVRLYAHANRLNAVLHF